MRGKQDEQAKGQDLTANQRELPAYAKASARQARKGMGPFRGRAGSWGTGMEHKITEETKETET
jgi:hypothetical protein